MTARFCDCAKSTANYDAHDRIAAMNYLQEHEAKGEIVTGLLYVEPQPSDLHVYLDTVATPLNQLSERELCPGAVVLQQINAALR